jgi:hypothetical protein
MGLMRRVESRVERSVGAVPRESAPDEPRRGQSRADSRYYVQPAELARKLVREMEDHKVSHSAQEAVCNYYTVFLCPQDYERLQARIDEVVDRLQRHLAKHVRSRRYAVAGDLVVRIVRDNDLGFGRFGILAERFDPSRPVRVTPSPSAPAVRTRSAGGTQVIAPADAAQLGLAHHTILLRAGNRMREFNQGRVVVGRARDADFRVDDPNVSRRHAAFFWEDGRIMVQDLESTNGTMVNGYPVSTTVLRPSDVVVIGDCRITVETR